MRRRAAGTALPGHLWTVLPAIVARLRAPRFAPSEAWALTVADPAVGPVRLAGRWRSAARGRQAALLLHGLGGSAESAYLEPLEARLVDAGWSTLRLHLRGADGSGEDLYHAGFTADIPRVLSAMPFAAADRLAVIGCSLGGHLALRFASEADDRRLAAVVAVCPPLDLELGARALDARPAWIYRRYILDALNRQYAAVASRRDLPYPPERLRRARTIREWDGLAIAPRFGFASAEEYYERASVAPRLGRIAVPTWIVAGGRDPMVPPWTVDAALREVSASTEVTWTWRGGHVGFPSGLDLGRDGARGLAGQIAGWLAAVASA